MAHGTTQGSKIHQGAAPRTVGLPLQGEADPENKQSSLHLLGSQHFAGREALERVRHRPLQWGSAHGAWQAQKDLCNSSLVSVAVTAPAYHNPPEVRGGLGRT